LAGRIVEWRLQPGMTLARGIKAQPDLPRRYKAALG
jgi:hypothetical protein